MTDKWWDCLDPTPQPLCVPPTLPPQKVSVSSIRSMETWEEVSKCFFQDISKVDPQLKSAPTKTRKKVKKAVEEIMQNGIAAFKQNLITVDGVNVSSNEQHEIPYSSTVEPMNSDYEKMVSTLQYEWTECNKKLILLKGQKSQIEESEQLRVQKIRDTWKADLKSIDEFYEAREVRRQRIQKSSELSEYREASKFFIQAEKNRNKAQVLLEKNQKKNAETKKKIATAAQAREFIRRVPSSVDLIMRTTGSANNAILEGRQATAFAFQRQGPPPGVSVHHISGQNDISVLEPQGNMTPPPSLSHFSKLSPQH